MKGAVDVQLHLWPWSVGNGDESFNLIRGSANVPFYGSPVLSVSENATVLLARRYERFLPFGPKFKAVDGVYQLYQTPHGVVAQKAALQKYKATDNMDDSHRKTILSIHSEEGVREVLLSTLYAEASAQEGDVGWAESRLFRTILAWSNFFDECILESKGTQRQGKLPWSNIADYIKKLAQSEDEPRMALIVHIADAMRQHLPNVVHAARRILVRERKMMPAPRVAETDNTCLQWYMRQPGTTSTEKAAANRHRLMGVSRYESLDTLENKVLKDFLVRCRLECRRYLNFDCNLNQRTHSERGSKVKSFGNICAELRQLPQLANISRPPAIPKPNYVLQNDVRYKRIWKYYLRLLRQEDEEDRLWDWQARTWTDISRLLVNAALMALRGETAGKVGYRFEEILASVFEILFEQRLGMRIERGSEPGPFLVRPPRGRTGRDLALEVVHPDLAEEHGLVRHFGRTGGHLYLVFSPLDGSRQSVVVVWAAHTAACTPSARPSWQTIADSAARALKRHGDFLSDRAQGFPHLYAFVVASDVDALKPDLITSENGNVHLVEIPTSQQFWAEAVDWIALVIEEVLGRLV
ncbi:conserved hypothetical protein [uncultured Desulfatiglans sp.]|uniref:DUF2357 domain-containing protein n=1 Tax=Uncultured Desulfatiglans sp. TaxID=1748965 RepID=A0A653A496_UNCDX|nr:conserved hypothetical protein [uncultured Desulfatiglans sp.]